MKFVEKIERAKFKSGLRLRFLGEFVNFFLILYFNDSTVTHIRVTYRSEVLIFYFCTKKIFFKIWRILMANRQNLFFLTFLSFQKRHIFFAHWLKKKVFTLPYINLFFFLTFQSLQKRHFFLCSLTKKKVLYINSFFFLIFSRSQKRHIFFAHWLKKRYYINSFFSNFSVISRNVIFALSSLLTKKKRSIDIYKQLFFFLTFNCLKTRNSFLWYRLKKGVFIGSFFFLTF